MAKEVMLNTAGLKFEYNKLASRHKCCGHDVSSFASRFRNALQTRPFSYGTTGSGTALGQAIGALNYGVDKKNAGLNLQKPLTRGQSNWTKARKVLDDIDLPSTQRSVPTWSSAHHIDDKRQFNINDRNAINKIYTGGAGAVYYDPGPRVYEALNNGYQMMDMYYGNNSDFWKGRDELIAHFIHHALKMPGSFDKDTSGRESYLKGYGTVVEGWANLDNKWGDGVPIVKYRCTSEPTYPKFSSSGCLDGLNWYTHTVAMSWVVRRMVQLWGGKIIYDGKAVTFSGIFENPPDTRDSNIEALDLFQYMGNGSGNMGTGTVDFHYGGVKIKPSKELFLQHWTWTAQDPAAPIDESRLEFDPTTGHLIKILKSGTNADQSLIELWDKFEIS